MKQLLDKRRKILALVIASLVILALSSPLIAEACKTPEKGRYDLDLYAKTLSGTSTVQLRATLTQITETWLHMWVIKSKPAAGELVYFYSCKSKGQADKYLGTAKTDKYGTATFPSWSAWTNASQYWFIAKFFSKDGKEHNGKS